MTADKAQEDTVSDLLAIFDITKKAELDKHCRTAVIHKQGLAALIMAAMGSIGPIRHVPIFKHYNPPHLELTDEEVRALSAAKVGRAEGAALKAIRKTGQLFSERRLFCGHMFWLPDNVGEWHLIYFDQRDTSLTDANWEHGPHVHLMNMVTHPRLDPNELLRSLYGDERPKLRGSLHVRYAEGG